MAKKKDETQTGDEAKKGKGKLLMIIVPVILALGAGAYFFLMKGSPEETAAATTTTVPQEGDVIEVGDLTVTLADTTALRYAKVGIAVVLSQTADSGLVGNRVPLIQDAAITVLTHFTAEQLLTDTGLEDLRKQLTDATVELFPDGDVMRVVLTQLVVQ